MSNFLAIATVTETLRQMLDAAISRDISGGARATAVRPTGIDKSSTAGLPEVGSMFSFTRSSSMQNGETQICPTVGQMEASCSVLKLHWTSITCSPFMETKSSLNRSASWAASFLLFTPVPC